MNLLYKIVHGTPFPLPGIVARDISRAFTRRIQEACQADSQITVEVNGGGFLEVIVPERVDREGFCFVVIGAIIHQRVYSVLAVFTATEKGEKLKLFGVLVQNKLSLEGLVKSADISSQLSVKCWEISQLSVKVPSISPCYQ